MEAGDMFFIPQGKGLLIAHLVCSYSHRNVEII